MNNPSPAQTYLQLSLSLHTLVVGANRQRPAMFLENISDEHAWRWAKLSAKIGLDKSGGAE